METWLTLGVLGVGAVILAIAGLWIYMSLTPPLHPGPQSVSSVIHSDPSRQWAAAVDRARQMMREGVSDKNLPGASVAAGVGGEVVWAEGFGWADIDRRTPIAKDTRFRIGTASMALTSAAVGLLLEKERLKLDEEIQTYVPEFPRKQWPVTLRQLMSHVGGVRNDGGDEGPLFAEHCNRPVEAFPHFASSDLLFEPGTEYRNSSFGWIVISAAVESAAAEPFFSFMQKQIFDPLKMDDTIPDSTSEADPGAATVYFPRFAGDPRYGPDPMRPIDLSCYSGASVFLSTPSDLVRFGMAIDRGKLLQPSTVQLLQTSQRLRSGDETGYGLGWDLETATVNGQPTQVVGHDGNLLGGQASSLVMLRDRGIVVAVTANISYADTYSLALKVAEAFAQP